MNDPLLAKIKNHHLFYFVIFMFCVIAFLLILIGRSGNKVKTPENEIQPEPVLPVVKDINYGSSPGRIICFSGGGLVSVGNWSAALGAILRRNHMKGKHIKLNDYLSSYQTMSGISGGSWFLTLITYSKEYYNMINREANGKSMFYHDGIDCLETKPLTNLTECSGVGVSKCQYNDREKCCCDMGYRSNAGGNGCVLCKAYPDELLLHTYLQRAGRAMYDHVSPKVINYARGMDDIIEILHGTTIPSTHPILAYALRTDSYVDLMTKLFSVVGIDRNSKISDNPNGFTNAILYLTGILQDGYISGDYYDKDMIEYTIENSACNGKNSVDDCGFITVPLTMGYHFGKKAQIGKIYQGNSNIDITYKRGGTNTVGRRANLNKYLETVDISNESPVFITTASGSALSVSVSPGAIKSSLKSVDPHNIVGTTESVHCVLADEGTCGVSHFIPSFFQHFSPTMKLNKPLDGKNYMCEEYKYPKVCRGVKMSYSTDWGNSTDNQIRSELPVKLGDGGYYDNISIMNSISAFQKSGVRGRCKLVAFAKDDERPMENGNSFAEIPIPFGMSSFDGKRCFRNSEDNGRHRKTNLFTQMVKGVFDAEDCSRIGTLYESTRNGDRDVQIEIVKWSDLLTVEDDNLGVKAGTIVDMYIVISRTESGLMFDHEGYGAGSDDIFNNRLAKESKLVYELLMDVPENVFDEVFGV